MPASAVIMYALKQQIMPNVTGTALKIISFSVTSFSCSTFSVSSEKLRLIGRLLPLAGCFIQEMLGHIFIFAMIDGK